MSKYLHFVVIISIGTILLAFQNCGVKTAASSSPNTASGDSGQSIRIKATIINNTLEGCGNLACTNPTDGTPSHCYTLVQADPSLLTAGNLLQIDGVLRSDLVSTCMVGGIIDVNTAVLVSATTN